MEKHKRLVFVLGLLALLLAACSEQHNKPVLKTAKILEQDRAQLAITLNKGYGTTVIATNNGERIEPCALAREAVKQQPQEDLKPCKADPADAKGKVLFEDTYKVTVREGSICITVISGSRKYRFCDPPYDLGF